jgi:hypothetical protein
MYLQKVISKKFLDVLKVTDENNRIRIRSFKIIFFLIDTYKFLGILYGTGVSNISYRYLYLKLLFCTVTTEQCTVLSTWLGRS